MLTSNTSDVLLRVPMTDDFVHCAMKINLKDLACVCLLSSLHAVTVEAIRSRCMRYVDLLRICPLYLITLITKHTTDGLNTRFTTLNAQFEALQTSTGMTPLNLFGPASNPLAFFDSNKLIVVLRELHATNTKLKTTFATIQAAANLGPSAMELLEKMETLRVMTDVEPLRPGHRAQLEDEFRHGEMLLRVMNEEVEYNVDRIDAQINVANGLMGQKSNEQNYQIAALTADDSRTMKAITVLTLTFLPGTMLASLWDAGIFSLDPDLSWKVYLGTTIGLTMTVFALWGIWMGFVSRKSLVDGVRKQEQEDSSSGLLSWLGGSGKGDDDEKSGFEFMKSWRGKKKGKDIS